MLLPPPTSTPALTKDLDSPPLALAALSKRQFAPTFLHTQTKQTYPRLRAPQLFMSIENLKTFGEFSPPPHPDMSSCVDRQSPPLGMCSVLDRVPCRMAWTPGVAACPAALCDSYSLKLC